MKRLLLLVIGIVMVMVFSASADDLIVDVDLTILELLVEDPVGHPVLNLAADDFVIFEDGQNTRIRHFSLEREPVALGIVVDRSSSINAFRRRVDRAVAHLMNELDAGDVSFLITFAGENRINVPLTNRHNDVPAALQRVPKSYGTRFYDAVFDSLEYLHTARVERKALVVFSDAADHYSAHSFDDIVEAARRYRYPMYFFGYVGDDSKTWTLQGCGRISEELGQLAALTGGKAIFPGEGVNDSRIATDIVNAVGYVYKIGFYNSPTAAKPANVRVQLRGERFRGYRVRFIPNSGVVR